MIYWSEFSWEAFTTLVTGLAAVGAAWSIGQRQTKIQAKQSEIQLQALRVTLFERRMKNYDSVRGFVGSVLIKPETNDPVLTQHFVWAQREAQFLFTEKVANGLAEIWTLCGDLRQICATIEGRLACKVPIAPQLSAQKVAAYQKVNQKHLELPELYAEMKLDLAAA